MAKIPAPVDARRAEKLAAFDRLLTILDELRVNCPWDKKQTWETLRHLTIEEVYELGDAILKGDAKGVQEELGDVMLHLVFYAKIASEQGAFDMADALEGICEKLIERHPHVYQDAVLNTEEEVKKNWERTKLKKGNDSTLQGVPPALPSIIKAMRIQEKARGVGFDFENADQAWDKTLEELGELQEAVAKDAGTDHKKKASELGDVLFSLINYARFHGINAEEALELANQKFTRRFQYIEQRSRETGLRVDQMTPHEMNQYWEQAKSLEVL